MLHFLLFVVSCLLLINSIQVHGQQIKVSSTHHNNNEADFPGHRLDFARRQRFNSNNPNSILNSDNVASNLADRQRYLFEHSNRRMAGRTIPNFSNNEAKFPGHGFDFVGRRRRGIF